MAIEIKSPNYSVHAVTIYSSSKAEVIRLFPVQLKSGQNIIKITSLPGTLDTKSVRLSGFGNARLQDVVCLINDKKRPSYNDTSEVIAALRSKRAQVAMEWENIQHESKALLEYSRSLKAEYLSPTDLDAFLNIFSQHNKKNLGALATVDAELKRLDASIALEEEKADLRKGPRLNGEITIVASSDSDTMIELRLTYIVTDATWKPTYELHATTTNGKPSSTVTLNYRADITQSTGEDWKDAQLTLSTYNTSLNTNIPRLFPLKIRPKHRFAPPQSGGLFGPSRPVLFGSTTGPAADPAQVRAFEAQHAQQQAFGGFVAPTQQFLPQQQPPTGTFGAPQPSPEAPEAEDGFVLADNEVEMAQKSGTVIKDSALAVTYSVDGQSTIPSDGIAHMVSISLLEFDCQIKHVAVPRVETMVYLQCEVKNTSEFRLLPGRVTVIFDGSFVSQTFIRDVPAGDTFTCTLGADPATKITYSRQIAVSEIKANAFAEGKRTTTYTITIAVTNQHPFPLEDVIGLHSTLLRGTLRLKSCSRNRWVSQRVRWGRYSR
jgi:hypothetical protein